MNIEKIMALADEYMRLGEDEIRVELRVAIVEALAEERERCAELMERQHAWISNVAASTLIRNMEKP